MKQPISAIGYGIRNLMHSILDLVFPNFCALCKQGVERQQLACLRCINSFANLCSKKLENETTELEVFSMFAYSQMTKRLVLSKFWQDTATLFKAGFSLEQCPQLSSVLRNSEVKNWIVVPVPLHWTREFYRGFNQAQILAEGFAKATNFEVVNLLARTRRTAFQSTTECKLARMNNMANAFTINTFRIIGRTEEYFRQKFKNFGVILVDDLLTSGATLLECTKIIEKKLNPKKIVGLTLCR